MTQFYFSQSSVIYFCQGFSCCPFYRGVRNSKVSARRELTKTRVCVCACGGEGEGVKD